MELTVVIQNEHCGSVTSSELELVSSWDFKLDTKGLGGLLQIIIHYAESHTVLWGSRSEDKCIECLSDIIVSGYMWKHCACFRKFFVTSYSVHVPVAVLPSMTVMLPEGMEAVKVSDTVEDAVRHTSTDGSVPSVTVIVTASSAKKIIAESKKYIYYDVLIDKLMKEGDYIWLW